MVKGQTHIDTFQLYESCTYSQTLPHKQRVGNATVDQIKCTQKMAEAKIEEEPDWECGCLYDEVSPFNKVLDDEVTSLAKSHSKESDSPLQHCDLLKPFLLDISNWGLNYAYHKYYGDQENPEKYKHTKTEHPINVIIIGAGMSGLVAAYELAQVGHNVTILEMQHRVGGRVKTISDSHFLKGSGLWSDCK